MSDGISQALFSMNEKYLLNHKEYSQVGLITHAENQLKLLELADWERDLFSFVVQWFSATEFVSIYTSGSTGTPKEIRIPKISMRRSAKRTLQFFDVKPLENSLLCLPVKYVAGMMMVVRAFVGSLNLITLPAQHLQVSSVKDKIGFAAMVPLQIERLLDEHQNLEPISKLILGGTPVSQGLTEKIKTSFKGQVWETYGMTETVTHVAVRKIEDEAQVFQALPGISFSIDDRECLTITDPFIQDQPALTNDRVELLSETSFRLLGRLDNVINSGGIKIQPEELERLFERYIDGRFCITSMPHETFGQIVVLVAEEGADMDRIRQGINTLQSYLRPKKILELDHIPVTRNGKIDVKAVKDSIIEMLK